MSTKRYYQTDGDGKGYQIWRIAGNCTFGLGKHRLASTCQLEAGIDNLFNYCDRTPHGLHLGTTTPGRTVYATLTVKLTKGKKTKFSNNTKSNIKQNENEED